MLLGHRADDGGRGVAVALCMPIDGAVLPDSEGGAPLTGPPSQSRSCPDCGGVWFEDGTFTGPVHAGGCMNG